MYLISAEAGARAGAGSEGLSEEAVLRRIQPVGAIELRDLSNPATLKTGEQVLHRAVRSLPRHRCCRCAQAGRRRSLGPAHRPRL